MLTHAWARGAAGFALAAALAACQTPPAHEPPAERVVLLPDEDGRATAVFVTRGDGRTVELQTPYAVAELGPSSTARGSTTEQEVQARYAPLFAVQPPRLRSFLLYFESDRALLTAASLRQLDRIVAEAALVPAAEIEVIGHADRRGPLGYNDVVGSARARVVARLMRERGFDGARLSVHSRGEREPLVPTPDEKSEPRNRRVEIRLR